MDKLTLQWSGFNEFEQLLDQINDDFGEKDAKNILKNAMRTAMLPVLESARGALETHGNIDTGQLFRSLQVESRKPNARDKRSRYTSPTMIWISRVTVAAGSKYIPDDGGKGRLMTRQYINRKTGKKEHMHGDARAFAIEFGTARWMKGEGMPFIRPALESNSQKVTNSLTGSLRDALLKYKSKHMTTGK
jgi:hypothetical protein